MKTPVSNFLLSRLALTAVVFLTLSFYAQAGVLLDIYSEAVESAPIKESGDLRSQAAKQNIISKKRNYLPRLTFEGQQLWVDQDITINNAFGLRGARGNYENTRLNLELDQPLYDPTIKSKIEVARAKGRQVESQALLIVEVKTRRLIEQFLETAKLQRLILSTNRVVSRLEKELQEVTRRKEANVATVSEVQNIRLALASVKRDRSNFSLNRNYALVSMGPSAQELRKKQLQWRESKGPSSWGKSADKKGVAPEVKNLRAEVEEFHHQSRAVKRRSWPVLKLVARYGIDNGGNPEFGGLRTGDRDLNFFEGGLALRWNIFERGMNNSEAKEIELKKEAKKAELQQMMEDRDQLATYSKELLKHSRTSMNEFKSLMKEYKILKDASARAYEAGKGSYIDSVTAYMAYESALRDWTNAEHELLRRRITFYAQSTGWDKGLVQKVDAMFEVAK
ncbi:MAG: TolC family protein [Verrucomicrobiales bacterium]|nr:TolC family protein [Verrucomicrobiales bacterium]